MSPATPTADELLHLAEAALDNGHPDTTLELCERLLALEPAHPSALFLSAEAARDLRQHEVARAHYRQVIAHDPGHAEAWAGLGAVSFDTHQLDAARAAFARALRLQPDTPDALYGRALTRELRGDARGARRDYLRAARLAPRYPVPRRLSETEIRDLLRRTRQTAARRDPAAAAWMSTAPVVLEEVPSSAICSAYDPTASPAELLVHLTSPHATGAGAGPVLTGLPPAVLVFRRNVDRFASDPDGLVEALAASLTEQITTWLADAGIEA